MFHNATTLDVNVFTNAVRKYHPIGVWALLVIAAPLYLFPSLASAWQDPDSRDFFEAKIRPVLIEHCSECHGVETQESNLRVDHIDFLTRKASYGQSVVRGNPQRSLLIQAISHDDPELEMPEGGERLPDTVIDDFRSWIAAGAYWPDEPTPEEAGNELVVFDLEKRKERLPWIWQTPQKHPLPLTERSDWPVDRVDHFVLARLEREGLAPADVVEPRVWLRRVYFAIIGLPPTPDEVEAFEKAASDDLQQAKEQVVDQLLNSPHFGERWARHWMDLVRYAESRGHESDFAIANAWRYRDYLIRAFNEDVPYNQFVIEHLAGDLVVNPRLDAETGSNQSVLGTGWAFLGEEIHSPVDIRQDELERVDNKVDVLSKTFLGLTIACARCHDHKFDAIRQADYYALSGFVQSADYRQVRFESMEHNRQIARRLAEVESATQVEMSELMSAELARSLDRMERLVTRGVSDGEGTLSDTEFERDEVEKEWRIAWDEALRSIEDQPFHPLYPLVVIQQNEASHSERVIAGIIAKWKAQAEIADAQFDEYQILADFRDTNDLWLQDGFTFGLGPRLAGTLIIGDESNPIRGISVATAAVKNSIWDDLSLAPGNEADSGSLAGQVRTGRTLRTRKVSQTSGKLFYLMAGNANAYAGVDSHLMVIGPLHGHLVQSFGGELSWQSHDVSVSEGERVYVQLGAIKDKPLEIRMVVEGDKKPELIVTPNPLMLDLLIQGARDANDLNTKVVQLLRESLAVLNLGDVMSSSDREARAQLVDWMLANPELFPIDEEAEREMRAIARKYLEQCQQLKNEIQAQSATAVAWFDGNGVNERVLGRGKYTLPEDAAPRSLPKAFENRYPIEVPTSGRLELANQIVDAQNPLTARVIVNRVWHHLFSRGIVGTVDNFGWLGERPTHPELLDDLAWTFQHDEQWSLKRLIRRLVLSQTYAMSSRPQNQEAELQDPNNLLLHRMPVRKLEAEVIRDSVLATSGRLDRTVYGPPVPVHLTEFVIGRGSPAQSGPLDGNGRRSVYTAGRRNFIPTLMTTFDFPTPFSTVGRRNVTNVPAQSLALMNDPFIYQQAMVWARRILDAGFSSDEERIRQMYLEAFARDATKPEIDSCTAILEQFRANYDEAQVVEPWRDLCHALFSINEFIYLQ